MKATIAARAIDGQIEANRSARGHAASFAAHRLRMTQEIAQRAPASGDGRLCLLGVGNGQDVDLAALTERYLEVHLVDVDVDALEGVREGAAARVRERLRLHAPVDVSGSWDQMGEWARRAEPATSLAGELAPAVKRVVAALPGPFDVVVSCCMLTQLQLVVLDAVGDRHPAFDPLRAMQNAIHVRVLAGLTAPGGCALLFTDLTSDTTYPLDALPPETDLGKLMSDLVAVGNVIHAAHPGLLSAEIRRDPVLSVDFKVSFPVGPWLWHNGPERIFLVYGLEISRAPSSETSRPVPSGSAAPSPATPPGVASPPPDGGGRERAVIELEDLIPRLYQDQIENTANSLPWYFHPESARPDLNFTSTYSGFFHMSFDAGNPNPVASPINAILVPLLFIFCEKAGIKFNALLRIRLGLFTRTAVDVPFHNPHVDFYEPHNVALYYVNDSDGDTVVFNETAREVNLQQSARHANENRFTELRRIPPRKGSMVFFDGQRYHASMHPRAHQSRIVVTFNFR